MENVMPQHERRRFDLELYVSAPRWWCRCECGATVTAMSYREQYTKAPEGMDCGNCGRDVDESMRMLYARRIIVLRLLPLPHLVEVLRPRRST